MHGPDAPALLDVWERGLTQSLPRRAVALLCLAWPDATEDEVLHWPIGLRDARLLALRRWLFGAEVTIVAACPACGAVVESTFGVDEVMVPESPAIEALAVHAIERAGFAITFRLPGSGDLLALAESAAHSQSAHEPAQGSAQGSAQEAAQEAARQAARQDPRAILLARCVIDARGAGGESVDVATLPDAVQHAVAETMAAADPQADVQLACTCPACGWTWAAAFDIASVLWAEIHAWARRTLRDVHALALAYGWREADVLTLSPTRRELYLELVGS
jgi:uncharacterized protein (UPF0212 family)